MIEKKVLKNPNINDPNQKSFEERQLELEEIEQREKDERERLKKSPFSNFYQFNREHSKEIIWLQLNYPKAAAILSFLLDQMDNYNAVMCSHQVLQESLSIGKTTVSTSIRILKECGFVTVYKSGTSNVYAVNKKLAWSSWGTNYKYAMFDAKIIISESEQEQKDPEIKTVSEKLKQITIKNKDVTA